MSDSVVIGVDLNVLHRPNLVYNKIRHNNYVEYKLGEQ